MTKWEQADQLTHHFRRRGRLRPQMTYLKAAKYSGSPMGGSKPPAHATLTLKPSPLPVPTWKRGCKAGVRRTESQAHPTSSPPDREAEAQKGDAQDHTRQGQTDRGESQWTGRCRPSMHSPHPQPHCLGRSCRRRGDEGKCRVHWGPGRKSAVCRCRGEHPVQYSGQWVRGGTEAERRG